MFNIITCGGTIDKIYFDNLSDFTVGESHVRCLLKSINANCDFNHIPLFQKDSLDMTNEDRIKLAQVVQKVNSDVLITHGTDTMIDTAKELFKLDTRHRVVLTGSMQPYLFKGTDAVFNIGFALGVMSCMTSGIYIAMNGEVFSSFNNVIKDRENNRFKRVNKNEIVQLNTYKS